MMSTYTEYQAETGSSNLWVNNRDRFLKIRPNRAPSAECQSAPDRLPEQKDTKIEILKLFYIY